MRGRGLLLAVVLLQLTALVTAGPARAAEGLEPLPVTFDTPLLVTAPDGDDRLFVVERAGRIRVVDADRSTVSTFADLRALVGTAGEGGLLGLAFSPEFTADGRLWVHYTQTDGDSRVDRLEVDASGTRVDLSSRTRVLEVDQPFSNHNGGMIAFAPDGMLLVGLGDGGGGGDPLGNGQDTSTLLGSVLRLDVLDRSGSGYGIPADNPFVGTGGRDEIWLYGLRNPYRFSVDRQTGDVWIGDVGQSTREEVDRVAYEPSVARNLGWDRWEGTHCFEACGSTAGITFPVHEYGRGDGRCSITGGHVVRAPGAESLAGRYLFGDFCDGHVRVYDPGTDTVRRLTDESIGNVFSFGEDGHGNVYVMNADRVFLVRGSGTRYVDVSSGSTFATVIGRLADSGVTRGCNPPRNDRFCPDRLVTRGQMAAFLTRAAGYERRPEPFRDVAADDLFAAEIGAIAAEGITRGCNPPDNDRFCPDRVVTRAQLAAFLVRALDLPPAQERFVDVASDDLFAADIGALAAARITRGCNPPDNDRFCPDAPVTRQQMAAFLVRAFGL